MRKRQDVDFTEVPKFIQIAATHEGGAPILFGLDRSGRVWTNQGAAQRWIPVTLNIDLKGAQQIIASELRYKKSQGEK